MVFRWGGEEFMVIFTGTRNDDITNLAENLRSIIETHHFETIGTVTASFGVTTYKEDDTFTSIVHRADNALYEAKHSGRNRVVAM